MRYELEKSLMDQSLSVRDLPDAWAEKYRKYLGIEVTDPLQGVLQDIHWAHGAIGYFPVSVLGRCIAASISLRMEEELDLVKTVNEGDFAPINRWNQDHVWRKIGIIEADTIVKEIVGGSINSDAYVRYLKSKFTELYKLT